MEASKVKIPLTVPSVPNGGLFPRVITRRWVPGASSSTTVPPGGTGRGKIFLLLTRADERRVWQAMFFFFLRPHWPRHESLSRGAVKHSWCSCFVVGDSQKHTYFVLEFTSRLKLSPKESKDWSLLALVQTLSAAAKKTVKGLKS